MSRFQPEQFTATEWNTAEEKARFARQFVRFVESDFKETLFPKWFYNRLSMTFGHIAHYSHGNFYATFFTNARDKARFIQQCAEWGCWGDPAFTYCDVEKALQKWMREEKILETALQLAHEEQTRREIALRDELLKKHPLPGGSQ